MKAAFKIIGYAILALGLAVLLGVFAGCVPE